MWNSTIYSRAIRKSGCPYCSGRKSKNGINDFATLHPELLQEWNYSKNDKTPEQFKQRSHKKIWWICKDCSLEWAAPIYSRVDKLL
jgi:ribosomal protein L37AE/L43A